MKSEKRTFRTKKRTFSWIFFSLIFRPLRDFPPAVWIWNGPISVRSQHVTRLLLVVGYENPNFFEKMTVFEKWRFSGKVSKNRFHIPLFGIVLIFSHVRVYIKKFKNYSIDFQAVTYPTLIVCKSISCVNFVDMRIFYTKRPNYKILLYLLCINTLQENPTFRTICSGPPDRLKQQAVGLYI